MQDASNTIDYYLLVSGGTSAPVRYQFCSYRIVMMMMTMTNPIHTGMIVYSCGPTT